MKTLRELRGKRTLAEVSRAAGIGIGTLSEMERGLHPGHSVRVVSAVARALGVTMNEVMKCL